MAQKLCQLNKGGGSGKALRLVTSKDSVAVNDIIAFDWSRHPIVLVSMVILDTTNGLKSSRDCTITTNDFLGGCNLAYAYNGTTININLAYDSTGLKVTFNQEATEYAKNCVYIYEIA